MRAYIWHWWRELQRHSNSGTVASDSMKLEIWQPFTSRQSSGTVSAGANKSSADIFPCDEPSYVLTFSTEEAMEQYMTLGRHRHELEREREITYDRIRRAWANRVSELGPPAGHVTITVKTVATNEGVVGLSSHLRNQFEWQREPKTTLREDLIVVSKQRRKLFHKKLRERCWTLDVKMASIL